MASASYTEDLTCSICLTIFTDPVTLCCGHSFCRKCITISLSAQKLCPQCRRTVPTEEKYLQTIYIVKSLAEKAKIAEKTKNEQRHEKTEVVEFLCLEHEEKLKLFCETDQQLACVICRDGERHDGHKFKPIKEAATFWRQELEKSMESLPADIHAIESLANTQREEITKTQATSHQLMTQISTQFEEMHQFLREREEEIKNELQEKERGAVEEMTEKLNAMDMALSESRELEVKVTSALEVSDSVKFLQNWTEVNNMRTPESLFRPRANDLQVAQTSLCLGPYESHLQFFVWKEMLQVIKPRAEQLSLRTDNTNLIVSHDGRSLLCSPQSSLSKSDSTKNFASTQVAVPVFSQTAPLFGSGSTKATVPVFSQTAPLFGSGSTKATVPVFSQTAPLFGSGSTKATVPVFSQTAPLFGSGSTKAAVPVFSQTPPCFGSGSTKAAVPVSSQTAPSFGSGSTKAAAPVSSQTAPSFGSGSTKAAVPVFSQMAPCFGSGSTKATALDFGKTSHKLSLIKTNHAFSVNEFISGQHYWEIEVGKRHYWELGVSDNFLKYVDQKYVICNQLSVTQLPFTGSPRKIGIYLNCSSKELSFYDADSMKHVHTVSSSLMSLPVSAYFNIGDSQKIDPNPLTVCWY